MCRSKILHFLFVASIFVLSNSSHATVHDFGNLPTLSNSHSRLDLNFKNSTYTGLSGVDLATELHTSNYAPSDYAHDDSNNGHDFPNEHSVNVSGMAVGQAEQNEHFDIVASAAPLTTVAPITGYTSVAAPIPEPETYAMILAGLAMILFTARRRN